MSKETHPSLHLTGECLIFTYHLFSLFTCHNFFPVPVGDLKGTKTTNFPLTSIPSIGIKTLEGKLTHPSQGQELKSEWSNH